MTFFTGRSFFLRCKIPVRFNLTTDIFWVIFKYKLDPCIQGDLCFINLDTLKIAKAA